MKQALQALLRSCGYELRSYSLLRNHGLRRARVLRSGGVRLLLDGGANRGDYALEQRRLGYEGEILSIEPLTGPFRILERRARRDPLWSCLQVALAARDGELEMREAEISQVSSALEATGAVHTDGWQTGKVLNVRASRIDSIVRPSTPVFLKLDLQGYELEALKGA